MTFVSFAEQLFNGIQYGMALFLVSSGLTLIFGIMNFINLAHGSQVMIGAYLSTYFTIIFNNFFIGILIAIPITFIIGYLIEILIVQYLYKRDHLDQVLVSFGLILFFNELITIIFGTLPLYSDIPNFLTGQIMIFEGLSLPIYRLFIILIGILFAIFVYILINKSRIGMYIRAGSTDSVMVSALGINIKILFRLLFSVGAVLAGIAGMMLAPLTSVEPSIGDSFLILSLVIIIIGGIGSIHGAFIAAMLVGILDTVGRVFLPTLLRIFLDPSHADGAGPALSSMLVYLMMALILLIKPNGLFTKKY